MYFLILAFLCFTTQAQITIPGVLQIENMSLVGFANFSIINVVGYSTGQLSQIVDLQPLPDGSMAVVNITNEEYFEYSINVITSGQYTMDWRFATIISGQTAFVYLNGVLSTTIQFFSTISDNNYNDIQGNINIPTTGISILRIIFSGGVNYDSITFSLTNNGNQNIPIYNIPIIFNVTNSLLTVYEGQTCHAYGVIVNVINRLDNISSSLGNVDLYYNNDGSVNFHFFMMIDSFHGGKLHVTVTAVEYGFSTILDLDITILNSPPQILIDNEVVIASSLNSASNIFAINDYKNPNAIQISSSLGSITLSSDFNSYVWIGSNLNFGEGDFLCIVVTATDSQNEVNTNSFFVAKSGVRSIKFFNINYGITIAESALLPCYVDDDLIRTSTARMLGFDASNINSPQINGNRRLRVEIYETRQLVVNFSPLHNNFFISINWLSYPSASKMNVTIYNGGLYLSSIFNKNITYVDQISFSSIPIIQEITYNLPQSKTIFIASTVSVILVLLLLSLVFYFVYHKRKKAQYIGDNEFKLKGITNKHENTDLDTLLPYNSKKISEETPSGEFSFFPDDGTEPLLEPERMVNTSFSALPIIFQILPYGDKVSLNLSNKETLSEVKRKLSKRYPDLGYPEQIRLFFAGELVYDESTLSSIGCTAGNSVINVIHKYMLDDELLRDLGDEEHDDYNRKTSLVDLVLIALSKRKDSNPLVRRYARNLLFDLHFNDSNSVVLKAIRLSMQDDLDKLENASKHAFDTVSSSGSSWIPLDESLSYEEILSHNAAKEWQCTSSYVLLGETMNELGNEIQVGLIKPYNYDLCCGLMKNLTSVIWKATSAEREIFIKGILPLNPLTREMESKGDEEYKIQLSMGPHHNIAPIIHQFVGSSSLIYPFISEEIRNMNENLYKSSGRRLIRRYTTYFVSESYKENLQQYKNKFFIMNERLLCTLGLQLLDGVCHMGSHKIVHCNLNENNVFVQDGKIFITDFSSAISCSVTSVSDAVNTLRERKDHYSLSPEVLNFLQLDDYEIAREMDIWDILKQNDVFAVGLLIKSLGQKNELPMNHYSQACIDFFDNLTNENPNLRMDAKIAYDKLKEMLYGQPHLKGKEENAPNWNFDRCLDLVFNVGQNESRSLYIGSNNYTISWPPSSEIEYELCLRNLKTQENENIIRL